MSDFKVISRTYKTVHYKNNKKDQNYITIGPNKFWDSGPMVFSNMADGWIPIAIKGVSIRNKDNKLPTRLVLSNYSLGNSISSHLLHLYVANPSSSSATMSSITCDVLCMKGNYPLGVEYDEVELRNG